MAAGPIHDGTLVHTVKPGPHRTTTLDNDKPYITDVQPLPPAVDTRQPDLLPSTVVRCSSVHGLAAVPPFPC